jgi:hypothetical protein
MSPSWPFDHFSDEPEEEPEAPQPVRLPLRRAPCPMCFQKGWIWEVLTSVRT